MKRVEDSIEKAYYVTLGLAYEGPGRLAGSAFEPLLKKCDFFMRRSLDNAFVVRLAEAMDAASAAADASRLSAHGLLSDLATPQQGGRPPPTSS
jgi:hypothetical protein